MKYKIEQFKESRWRRVGGNNRLGIARGQYNFMASTGGDYRLIDTETKEILFSTGYEQKQIG